MIDTFKSSLEAVSGRVHQPASPDQLPNLLHSILKDLGADQMAIDGSHEVSSLIPELKDHIRIIDPMAHDYASRKNLLASCPNALVSAPYAIAETGTLVFTYNKFHSTLPHFLSLNIIALLDPNTLLPTQAALLSHLKEEELKNMVLVTGPSRTADIEKVLVLGAHGPATLHVILNLQ